MPTYTLPVRVTLDGHVEIEAESAQEAIDAFENEMKGLDEALTYEATWEIVDWESQERAHTIERKMKKES